MVELVPTELSERKALQRRLAENEKRIADILAKIEQNEVQIEENNKKLKISEIRMLKHLTFQAPVAFTLLSLIILVYFIFAFPQIFANVATDYGDDAYAEYPIWLQRYQPGWLRMPANTLVNVGYILVGIYWICKLNYDYSRKIETNTFIFAQNIACREKEFNVIGLEAGFAWSSVLYGFIQAARLFCQTHNFCVLDQWVTLPLFTLCGLLCHTVKNGPTSYIVLVLSLFVSFMSYLLVLASPIGFEIALGLHIIIVVGLAVDLCLSVNDKNCWKCFSFGVLYCIGFVGLKLADFQLASIFFPFRYLSGHFWSKICDILQIHYSLLFIEMCQSHTVAKMKSD